MPSSFLIGTAAAVNGQTVTVQFQDGTTLPVRKDASLTVAVGDGVRLARLAGAQWVTAVITTAAPAPEPPSDGDGSTVPVPPPPTEKLGSKGISPVSTGTIRRGARRPDTADLYQGDYSGTGSNFGCAWYGTRIKDLPGVLTGFTIALNRGVGGDFGARTPTMCLLGGATWPASGNPATLATATGPALAVGASAQWVCPAEWLTQLESGAAGGVGIFVNSRTPYVHLLTAGDGMTGTATWEES